MSEEFGDDEPSCGLWNDVIEEEDEIESDIDIGSLDGRGAKLEVDPIFINGFYSQFNESDERKINDNRRSLGLSSLKSPTVYTNNNEDVDRERENEDNGIVKDIHNSGDLVGVKRLYLRDIKSQNQLNIARDSSTPDIKAERKRSSDEKLKFTDLKVSGYFVYDKDSPNNGKVYGTVSYESDSGTSDASFNEKGNEVTHPETREDGDGTTDEEVQGFQELDIEEFEKSIRKRGNPSFQTASIPQKYFNSNDPNSPEKVAGKTPFRVYEVNPPKSATTSLTSGDPKPEKRKVYHDDSSEEELDVHPVLNKQSSLNHGEGQVRKNDVMKPAVSVKDIAKLFEGSTKKRHDPFDKDNLSRLKKSPWVSMPDLADRPVVDHPTGNLFGVVLSLKWLLNGLNLQNRSLDTKRRSSGLHQGPHPGQAVIFRASHWQSSKKFFR